jgi:hypothetical protein
LLAELGTAVAAVRIQPVGSAVGDWRHASVADGYMIVRHPELQKTLEMAARVGRELQIYAA